MPDYAICLKNGKLGVIDLLLGDMHLLCCALPLVFLAPWSLEEAMTASAVVPKGAFDVVK